MTEIKPPVTFDDEKNICRAINIFEIFQIFITVSNARNLTLFDWKLIEMRKIFLSKIENDDESNRECDLPSNSESALELFFKEFVAMLERYRNGKW